MKALNIGEELDDQKIIGYACTWLSWSCVAFGRPNEAITFGEKAQKIAKMIKDDQYLFFKSLGGLGMAYYVKGDKKKVIEIGERLTKFGQTNSNIRSQCLGQGYIGDGYNLEGNFPEAIKYRENSVKIAADPFYAEFMRVFLGMNYILNGEIDKAESVFNQGLNFGQKFGVEIVDAFAEIFMGVIHIAQGRMLHGLNLIKTCQQSCLENQNIFVYCLSEYVLGKIYSEMAQTSGPMQVSKILRNIGFLIRNVPFASKNAEYHFNKAIKIAKDISAKNILGQVYLDLGLLRKTKKKELAQKNLSKAIEIFEQCTSDIYLKQAKDALVSLE
jgi:tetratricopeptide (TPR) repeat protein